jgi:molecular chaperone GrpE
MKKDKKDLKKQSIKKKTIKIEEYIEMEDRYKRALADYQNLQKRSIEEKNDFAKYANENLLHEILPIYDNLKISLLHINEEANQNGWAEGIKYVIKQFKEVLKNAGVEEIETEGKKFDINTMEAIEGKGEKVKKEIKPGYKLNGKVIIAAKVSLK